MKTVPDPACQKSTDLTGSGSSSLEKYIINNIYLLLGGPVRSGDRDLKRGREEEEGSERGQCKIRGVSGIVD